jgi:putative transposase
MKENRYGSHSVTRLTAHIVWVMKYRYLVLEGNIQKRCRELIIQSCDAEDVRILKGVVSRDHTHTHIDYPPSNSLSDLVERFKGRTPTLAVRAPGVAEAILGRHFWAIGYGAWSASYITGEMVQEYLEYHRHPSDNETNNLILEE